MPRQANKKTAASKAKKNKDDAGKRKVKTPQLLRGMKDILPEDQKYWNKIRDTARNLALDYSFGRIDTPTLEFTDLFIRSVGKQTDIVEKEMYSFQDQGGDNISLRPEGTASVARAYINHGMLNRPQPVKLFYIGPMFRYDRPQAGRQRQFWQFGFETLGNDEPIVDAQLIFIAYNFFRELGLDVKIEINSIGTLDSRQEYKVELVSYFRSKRARLCENCKKRLSKNPLRLLDCKEEGCIEVREEAPQILDWLDEASKNHFMKVLEFLDEAGVVYELNPYLVRGLDYYTRTVFEVVAIEDEGSASLAAAQAGEAEDGEDKSEPASEEVQEDKKADEPQEKEESEEEKGLKAQSALGGGGRYDGLIEMLGGHPTPACGFSVGMERVVNLMKERAIDIPEEKEIDIMFAQLGEAARRRGLLLFEEIRKEGFGIVEAFGKNSLKSQLELANKMGARYTLILGQKEVMDETIIVRDMDSGSQEIVDMKKIVSFLKKKMAE